MAPVKNVIIIGVGNTAKHPTMVSLAYRLSPGLAIHLLDPSPSLFASTSRKAGGLLAHDRLHRPTASLGLGALIL